MKKTIAAAVVTTEDKIDEPTLQVVKGGTSAVLVEVPRDVAVEPSEERIGTANPSFLSSKQTRFVRSEDIPLSKTSEELVKELTLS